MPSVLVVDDNEFNLIPVTHMLRNDHGIEAEVAENGLVALNKYKSRQTKKCECEMRNFRLIIMDVQMPIMDGKEASREILQLQRKSKMQEDRDYTKIVFLTSFTNKKLQKEAEDMGVKKVFNKPLRKEDLK
jgi:CheY-like chemotaxis protein